MAIKSNIDHKGIKVDGAYIKLKSVKLDIEVYASEEARKEGKILEHKYEYVDVNSELYSELKKLYPDCIDILEEGQ